jgi:hypothetical protein
MTPVGLLKHLLFWPVTGPTFLARFSLEKIEDVAREELTDDSAVKEALLELQMAYEMGEVDDAAYAQREAELMEQLREVRRWREEFGMGTRGGPVQVARDEADAGDERPGGVASSEGASVEFNLDWDDDRGEPSPR